MRHLLDELQWYQADEAASQPYSVEELVNVEDGDAVLHFTYRFLETHLLPPSDDEVHSVTTAIAQYRGPRVVQWATLESYLAGLVTV